MREASRSGPSIRLKLVLVLTVAAAGVAVPILATYSNSQRLHLVDLTREEWRTTARTVAFGAAIGLSSGDYYDMKSALDWLLDQQCDASSPAGAGALSGASSAAGLGSSLKAKAAAAAMRSGLDPSRASSRRGGSV